ncbi:MAG: hypothetical protein P8I93_01380 [Crocinitomicaceae bacterium]|nr:hypothetical protein [Crocinitomicaceae bacterium]
MLRRKRRKRANNNFFPFKKKRVLILLCAISLIFAFSCENKKEKVIHLNLKKHRNPQTELKKRPSSPLSKITYFDDLNGIDSSFIIVRDSLVFILDRFSSKEEKYLLSNKHSKFSYYAWSFLDSLTTKNAYYNWLDCFGESCKSIKFFDTTLVIDKTPFLIFKGEKTILYIKSNKNLKPKRWMRFLDEKFLDEKSWILIEQRKHDKPYWYKYPEMDSIKENN